MNAEQKGFLIRVLLALGLPLAGALILRMADGRMDVLAGGGAGAMAWTMPLGGLLMLVGGVISIMALRYGGAHQSAIRQSRGFAGLLLLYRLYFWLSVAASVLSILILFWLVAHLGPVR